MFGQAVTKSKEIQGVKEMKKGGSISTKCYRHL